MENQEEKTQEIDLLANYVKELKEDVNITVQNIREKSLTTSALRAKWLNYYFVRRRTGRS